MASGKIISSYEAENSITSSTSLVGSGTIFWLKKRNNFVTGTGSSFRIENTLSDEFNVIGTLPSGYLPIGNTYTFMVGEYGGEFHPVRISHDGNITVLTPKNGGSISSDWYSIGTIAWVTN